MDTQINIYGPTQVLPNATKAEQHFYGDKVSEAALRRNRVPVTSRDLTGDEFRLYTYILDAASAQAYSYDLGECRDTKALARVIVSMTSEKYIDKELIVKAEFLEVILGLARNLNGSRDVAALRAQVNNILCHK